jgi:hypothetical protein
MIPSTMYITLMDLVTTTIQGLRMNNHLVHRNLWRDDSYWHDHFHKVSWIASTRAEPCRHWCPHIQKLHYYPHHTQYFHHWSLNQRRGPKNSMHFNGLLQQPCGTTMTTDLSLPHFKPSVRQDGDTNTTILCLDYLMSEGTIKIWRPLDHS